MKVEFIQVREQADFRWDRAWNTRFRGQISERLAPVDHCTTNEDRSSWSKRVQESMRSAPLHIILGALGKTTKRAQISDAQDAQDKK